MADNAYNNDLLEHDAERLRQITAHFSTAGTELAKTGVTRQLLWREYMALHPDGYSYSRYCHHLNQYLKNRDLSIHLEYEPADMIMIDYEAHQLVSHDDLATGGKRTVREGATGFFMIGTKKYIVDKGSFVDVFETA